MIKNSPTNLKDISKLLNPKSFEVAILWEPSESFP